MGGRGASRVDARMIALATFSLWAFWSGLLTISGPHARMSSPLPIRPRASAPSSPVLDCRLTFVCQSWGHKEVEQCATPCDRALS